MSIYAAKSMQVGLCWLSLFSVTVSGQSESTFKSTLSEAIDVYQSAMVIEDRSSRVDRFRRAYLLFERASEDGQATNAPLLTNMGNAALQADKLGSAVHAFRRATQADPSYRRAQTNLAYARSQLPSWAVRQASSEWFGSSVAEAVTRPKFRLLVGGWFLLVSMLLARGIVTRQAWLRNVAYLLSVVWLAVFAAMLWSQVSDQRSAAVVLQAEVVARSADSVNSAPRLTTPVPGGTELVILEDRGDWVYARIGDSQAAWFPNSAIGRL